MNQVLRNHWADIGALNDIPLRGARVVKTMAGPVAVFRTDHDEVFATADRGEPKVGPLSEGMVHGRSVTCPMYSWVFSLESGQAQGADEGQIATYAVKVEGGRILMDVSAFAVAAE